MLSNSDYACITKVDRESVQIVDQGGNAKTVLPSRIGRKIERDRNAVSSDANGSEVRPDDTVREKGLPNKQGVILHMQGGVLFILNREYAENSGIFVARANTVATVAVKGGRQGAGQTAGPDLSRMNPALQRNGNSQTNGLMAPPKFMGRDRLIGQTVRISKGPYKGLIGIVKEATDTEARIELHAKKSVTSVPKDCVKIKDGNSDNFTSYIEWAAKSRGTFGAARGGGYSGGMGGSTPRRTEDFAAGGRTPMAAANGGRTPGWLKARPGGTAVTNGPFDGSRTAYGNGNDGGRTAYGGGGGGGGGGGIGGGGGGGVGGGAVSLIHLRYE